MIQKCGRERVWCHYREEVAFCIVLSRYAYVGRFGL
jgi:hypothetical protein